MKQVPDGYMKDRKGRLVPVTQVSDYDLEMDAFVRAQIAKARDIHETLKAFKTKTFDECYAWLDLVAEKYQRTLGGQKGNITFSTFDGAEQIRISVQDSLTFGPELQIAKDIIDECLSEWAKGANENLQALITDAFEVDKEGQLNTARILSLRRIKINDPRWLQAMEAIADSLQVAVSKTYLNFREQADDGRMVHIPLDIAGV